MKKLIRAVRGTKVYIHLYMSIVLGKFFFKKNKFSIDIGFYGQQLY